MMKTIDKGKGEFAPSLIQKEFIRLPYIKYPSMIFVEIPDSIFFIEVKGVFMLIDEMEKSGHWLFRWRSYLPLVTLTLLFSSLPYFTYPFANHAWDQIWELFCLLFSFSGLAIRIITIGFASERTSGRNTKNQVADTLNTSGMYSITRNPLYLGNYLVGLGFSMFFRVWWVTAIYTLIFFLYYERIIMAEEIFLKKKFTLAYVEWSKKTPLFIPKLRLWNNSTRLFNWQRVFHNEHQTLFIIVITFYCLEITGDFYLGRPFLDDKLWNIIAGVTTFSFIIARILHKHSAILQNEK